MQRCPRCFSEDVKYVHALGKDFIYCRSCKYDEREIYDVFPEERTSQKGKRQFSPYKTGGSGRVLRKG